MNSSDLLPEEKYSIRELRAMIDQTTGNMPHIQEILTGLLYHIEQIESRMDDPIGLKAFFNGCESRLDGTAGTS